MWLSFGLICMAALAAATVQLTQEELGTEMGIAEPCDEECICHVDSIESLTTSCRYLLFNSIPTAIPIKTSRLDISDNFFTHIKKETFENVNTPFLKVLIIENSNIETIDEDTFENTVFANSLKKIILSTNNLNNSQNLLKAMKPLKSLNVIELAFNPNLDCLEIAQGLHNVMVFCDDGGPARTEFESTLGFSEKFIDVELSATDLPAATLNKFNDVTTSKNFYSKVSNVNEPIDYWLNMSLFVFIGLIFGMAFAATGITVWRNYRKNMESWMDEEVASLEKLMAGQP